MSRLPVMYLVDAAGNMHSVPTRQYDALPKAIRDAVNATFDERAAKKLAWIRKRQRQLIN